MNYKKAKGVKVGEKYWFVDTDFNYTPPPVPTIRLEKIYRVVGNEFSTRNDEDIYEQMRFRAYVTKEKAIKKAIQELREYRKFINDEIKKGINQLLTPDTNSGEEGGR